MKDNSEKQTDYTGDQIKSWIEQNGVMSLGVSAGSRYFMNFSSGILSNTRCTGQVNHAVAFVGWGHDDTTGLDYWIIRNQWGTGWGDEGYIRIAVQDSGNGICMSQSSVNTAELRS